MPLRSAILLLETPEREAAEHLVAAAMLGAGRCLLATGSADAVVYAASTALRLGGREHEARVLRAKGHLLQGTARGLEVAVADLRRVQAAGDRGGGAVGRVDLDEVCALLQGAESELASARTTERQVPGGVAHGEPSAAGRAPSAPGVEYGALPLAADGQEDAGTPRGPRAGIAGRGRRCGQGGSQRRHHRRGAGFRSALQPWRDQQRSMGELHAVAVRAFVHAWQALTAMTGALVPCRWHRARTVPGPALARVTSALASHRPEAMAGGPDSRGARFVSARRGRRAGAQRPTTARGQGCRRLPAMTWGRSAQSKAMRTMASGGCGLNGSSSRSFPVPLAAFPSATSVRSCAVMRRVGDGPLPMTRCSLSRYPQTPTSCKWRGRWTWTSATRWCWQS